MLPDIRTLRARVEVEVIDVLNQWMGIQINEEVESVEIAQIAAEDFVTRMLGEHQEPRYFQILFLWSLCLLTPMLSVHPCLHETLCSLRAIHFGEEGVFEVASQLHIRLALGSILCVDAENHAGRALQEVVTEELAP